MVKSCCIMGCKQRYSKESGISFHRFPADPDLKEQWVKALARHNWEPSYHSLVCGKHFITGRPSPEPSHPDFIPSLFPHISMYQKYQSTYAKRVLLMGQPATALLLPDVPSTSNTRVEPVMLEDSEVVLNEDVVTSEFIQNTDKETEIITNQETDSPNCKKRKNAKPKRFIPQPRKNLRNPHTESISKIDPSTGRTVFGVSKVLVNARIDQHLVEIQEEMQKQMRAQQAEINMLQVQIEMLQDKNTKLSKEPKPTSRDVLSEVYLSDKVRCFYYTGLPNNECFLWLLALVENDVQKPSVKITPSKQLLLTLMKLKLDLQHIDLGYRFGIVSSTVCRILKFWIPVLIKNLQSFLESAEKDATIDSLLIHEVNQSDYAEYKNWPEKLINKAITYTNGLKTITKPNARPAPVAPSVPII